jgi:polyisoprenoid-binding protein YceI
MSVARQWGWPPFFSPPVAATLARGAWELDPARSTVSFAVPYWWGFGTVKGHFRRYTGRLDLGARPAIELTIDAASVDTGNARRDRRLHSEDFFAGPGRRRFARACRDASPHGARRCQS